MACDWKCQVEWMLARLREGTLKHAECHRQWSAAETRVRRARLECERDCATRAAKSQSEGRVGLGMYIPVLAHQHTMICTYTSSKPNNSKASNIWDILQDIVPSTHVLWHHAILKMYIIQIVAMAMLTIEATHGHAKQSRCQDPLTIQGEYHDENTPFPSSWLVTTILS